MNGRLMLSAVQRRRILICSRDSIYIAIDIAANKKIKFCGLSATLRTTMASCGATSVLQYAQ